MCERVAGEGAAAQHGEAADRPCRRSQKRHADEHDDGIVERGEEVHGVRSWARTASPIVSRIASRPPYVFRRLLSVNTSAVGPLATRRTLSKTRWSKYLGTVRRS